MPLANGKNLEKIHPPLLQSPGPIESSGEEGQLGRDSIVNPGNAATGQPWLRGSACNRGRRPFGLLALFYLLGHLACATLGTGREAEPSIAASSSLELEAMLKVARSERGRFHAKGETAAEAGVLETMGDLYERLGDRQDAVDAYFAALSRFVESGEEAHAARVRVKLVGGLNYLDFNDQAMEMVCEALLFYEREKDARGRATALIKMARLYVAMGEREAGWFFFYQAWELCLVLEQPALTAMALEALGTLYYWDGQLEEALGVLQHLLTAFPEEIDIKRELYLLNLIGSSRIKLGEPQVALEALREAMAIYENVGLGSAGVYAWNLADLYSLFGEKQRALEYADKSRRVLVEENAPPNAGASVNFLLGAIHQSAGDFGQARHFFKQALTVFRQIENQRGMVRALIALGDGSLGQGDAPAALDYLHQALQISRDMGNRHLAAICNKSLGVWYFRQNQPREALCFLEEALETQRQLGMREALADTHFQLGRIFLSREDLATAAYQCLEALALNEASGDQQGEALSLHLLARIHREIGRPAHALSINEEALEKIESLRVRIMQSHMRISYFDAVHEVFELQIELLMELARSDNREEYLARALRVSERARARGFFDLLQDRRFNRDVPEIQELVTRQNQVRARLNKKEHYRMRQLEKGLDEEELGVLDQAVEGLLAEFRALDGRIREIQVETLGFDPLNPLSLSEIRERVLDADTAMLEYFLGEERGFLWMVSSDELAGFELPPRAAIESRVHRILELLTERGRRERFETPLEKEARVARADAELPPLMSELSRTLLGPVFSRLQHKRLFIVADGALRLLPFGILPEPIPGNSGSVVPLLSRFEIVGAPSASIQALLKQNRQDREPAARALAVFADPVFSSDDPRLTGMAGPRVALAESENPIDVDSFVRDSIGVPERLRFTRLEARQMSQLWPPGEVYEALDFQASRQDLLDLELDQYRILHFATHGMISDTYPELSGLVLSLYNAAGQARDGFLRQYDIFGLNLNADLVVLSGCRTGLGKNSNGEGLIGLTRGFMYAGATRVMASRWMVQDHATAELMSRFYKHLVLDGWSPGHALRSAQLSMWREPRWRAAYYWGAFVLQGPWE